MKQHIFIIGILASVMTLQSAYAQKDNLGTKVIDVVKAYSPTIANANKPREEAPTNDSLVLNQKKINYTINSVPVASTFVPEKGKATQLAKKSIPLYKSSYAGFGGGNYATLFGDAYIYLPMSNEDAVYFTGNHYSSQGGIKDIETKDNFSTSNLELGYQHQSRDYSWGVSANGLYDLYNWYGVKPGIFSPTYIENNLKDKTAHSYFGGGANGFLKLNEGLFRGVQVSARVFADDQESMETYVSAQPKLVFELSDASQVLLDAGLNYLSGGFKRDFYDANKKIEYSYFQGSIHPSFLLNQDVFSVKLGATIDFVSGKEESKTKFYPDVEASVKLMDSYAILYAGADGGTRLNSYQSLTRENPYVSPNLQVNPTFENYQAFAGLKGMLAAGVTYNLKGFYGNIEHLPVFVGNVMSVVPQEKVYQYYNSFGVDYLNANRFGVSANLEGNMNNAFLFDINLLYQSYQMEDKNIDFAAHIPSITAKVNTDYQFIEEWFAGIDLSYVGERKAYDYNNIYIIGIPAKPLILKSKFLLDIHTDYTFNKRWTLFIKANNLLNNQDAYWMYYPTQGLQIQGGIIYQFRN